MTAPEPRTLALDDAWMRRVLVEMLRIASPTGRTDHVMQFIGEEVEALGLSFELNRRGTMNIRLGGGREGPSRAVVVHADTIGCMVRSIEVSGRLSLVPVGTHSARFSEGARVTLYADAPGLEVTGTILPRKASGHRWGDEVDTQGVGWEHVELRLDAPVRSRRDVVDLGVHVGDFVALHALPEITRTGFVKSRHLDDKAGVAAVLAAAKAVVEQGVELPVPTDIVVTITEEVGHGASSGLPQGLAEMVSIDAAVVAPGQESTEHTVTIAMGDMVGPFDYHFTRRLIRLADAHRVPYRRDVFVNYRSDVAAALEAGAETRAALIGPGVDATHGHERTHLDAIRATSQLVGLYLQTELTFHDWDRTDGGQLRDFPSRSVQPAPPVSGIADADADRELDREAEPGEHPGTEEDEHGAAGPRE